MSITRKSKAIYSAASLLLFSGLAFIVMVMIVVSGLGGYKPKLGAFEIIFMLSVFIALISYGYALCNILIQISNHKWSGLLIWEKLNILVLLAMLSPVYTTIRMILVIDFNKSQ